MAKQNAIINEMQDIENMLTLMCVTIQCSKGKWENLPNNLEEGRLERMLFTRGSLVASGLPEDFTILPYARTNYMSVYGELNMVQPIGLNHVKLPAVYVHDIMDYGSLKIQNGVLLRNNKLEIPTIVLVRTVIKRLTYIWQSLGINECISRARAIVTCEKTMSTKLRQNLTEMFGTSNPFVLAPTNANIEENINVQSFDVSYSPDAYWLDFDNTFNLLLTMLGVNNYNNSKKERLITDEVNANNEVIELLNDSFVEERKKFCEECNKILGTNLKYTSAKELQEKAQQNKMNMLPLDKNENKEYN